MRTKKTKKPSKAKLQREADVLWFKVCFEYYGYKCEVCGEDAEQMHHFFPKGRYGSMRYYIPNGVPLCRGCHFTHHHVGSPTIHATVMSKRGEQWYDDLFTKAKELCPSFKTIQYYQDTIAYLQQKLDAED